MAPADDMMDDDLGVSPKSAPAPAKKKSPVKLILIGLIVLVAAPTGTFFYFKTRDPVAAAEEAARKKILPPVVMDVDAITVNISGTRMTRILRVKIHLVLSEERLRPVLEEVLPMVKDRIMSTAARRTLDELESVDDRESLKRDIAMEINSLIRNRMSGSVLDVAFSEFLIQ